MKEIMWVHNKNKTELLLFIILALSYLIIIKIILFFTYTKRYNAHLSAVKHFGGKISPSF